MPLKKHEEVIGKPTQYNPSTQEYDWKFLPESHIDLSNFARRRQCGPSYPAAPGPFQQQQLSSNASGKSSTLPAPPPYAVQVPTAFVPPQPPPPPPQPTVSPPTAAPWLRGGGMPFDSFGGEAYGGGYKGHGAGGLGSLAGIGGLYAGSDPYGAAYGAPYGGYFSNSVLPPSYSAVPRLAASPPTMAWSHDVLQRLVNLNHLEAQRSYLR